MKTAKCIFVLYIALLGSFSISQGAVTNGKFETGDLSGWNSSGTVDTTMNVYARDYLGLSQEPYSGYWYPTEGNYFAALSSTDSDGTDVSSLSQTITANAGDILEFDYFFDYGDYAPYYDWSIGRLSFGENNITLFEINTSGNELSDDQNIDWTHLSYMLPFSGFYTLEFTIADGAVPGSFESILGVDYVRVIPAPGAIVLVGIGLSMLSKMKRRKML